MIDQKDRTIQEFREQGKEFPKPVHYWLAQYDEEDDFLCGKVANSSPEFTEEE
jgi:hypothetical protein